MKYLLRGFDGTLARRVYWYSFLTDGTNYTGPGPLSDITVQGTAAANTLQHHAGSPNGARSSLKGTLCIDTTNGLLYQNADGASTWTIVGTGSPFSPPELWAKVNVPASQTGVALSAQVSGNNNNIKMTEAGSVVGLSTRLTEAITAGTLTVTVTKNGAPLSLNLVHTSGTGSQAVQAVGVDNYVAGDLLGIQFTTDAGFLPITTDLEAWIECAEGVIGGGGGADLVVKEQTPAPNGPSPTMQFQALGIKPDGSKVYVGSQGGPEVWRFSTATNLWDTTPPAAIPLNYVRQFCFNATGTKMYVLLLTDANSVYIVDTATNLVTGTVTGLPFGAYGTMALQPGTNELWVHNNVGPGEIDRVDTSTDTFIASFPAATFNAYDMKFNPSGTKMYYVGANTLSFATRFHIYNATTHTLITSVSDTPLYRSIVALPDGSEVWVAIDGTGPNSSLVRYSTTTDAIVGTPILTSQDTGAPFHMVASNTKVYALLFSGDIDVVSQASHTITSTIAMGGDFAGDLIISPDTSKLYASKTQGTQPYWVKVVSTASELVLAQIESDSVTQPTPVTVGVFDSLRFVGAHVTDDGAGQAAVRLPVVYDVGAIAQTNIKANRPSFNASVNDQTKTGQTNFGSGGIASGDYATIGGGQRNVATGEGACVPGGSFCEATGINSLAMNDGAGVSGEGSFAANSAFIEGDWSAGVNYGSIDPGAEACFVTGDAFISAGSYGCTALNESFIDDNCDNSHAEGSASMGTGCRWCHVEGRNGSIDNDLQAVHLEGSGGYIGPNANYAHCEGESCEVGTNAYAAHAEGGGCTASGANSHAEGTSSEASGYYAHAQNGATTAQGEGSHAEGDGSFAEGDWSHAQGSEAHAFRETQFTHGGGQSGGFGSGLGVAQTSWLQFRAYPVTGPSTSALMRYGVNGTGITSLLLQDLRSYDFVMTAIVNGKVAGPVYKTRTITIRFNARCVAGVATIVSSGATDEYGDAATWTITVAVASGNTIEFTFNTGTDPHECFVSAKLEFVETRFFA